MPDFVAVKIADQIEALPGDAPLGAVADLVLEAAPVRVKEAVERWRRRRRACQEGDDLPYLRHDDDFGPIVEVGGMMLPLVDQ